MSVYYQGSDGHIKSLGDNELQHWKYIKKIGNRYFYTPEELKAYYADEQKKVKREEAFGVNSKDLKRERERRDRDAFREERRKGEKKRSDETLLISRDKNDNLKIREKTAKEKSQDRKKIDKKYDRKEKVDRFMDKLVDAASNAERKTRAIRNTAKAATGSSQKPKTTKSKYSKEDINKIQRKSWANDVQRKEAIKKKKKKEAAHKQYSPAARW